MDPLLSAWASAVGDDEPSLAAGRALLDGYAHPDRRYHDRRHLAEVLEALRVLSGGDPGPTTVVCAAYAHDAVYDGEGDDERRSADRAVQLLSPLLPACVVDEVARLVLLTVTHEVEPGDPAGALLCDADLAVLAAPPARYAEYARDVRAEYAHVDDAAFRRGRSAVLRRLLERPRLYATERGRTQWEAAARRNLRDEITALDAASAAADRRPAGG